MLAFIFVHLSTFSSTGRRQNAAHQGPDGLHEGVGQHALPGLPHHEGPQQSHLVRPLHQRPQVGNPPRLIRLRMKMWRAFETEKMLQTFFRIFLLAPSINMKSGAFLTQNSPPSLDTAEQTQSFKNNRSRK